MKMEDIKSNNFNTLANEKKEESAEQLLGGRISVPEKQSSHFIRVFFA